MKTQLTLVALAASCLLTAGCFSYDRRTVATEPVVVRENVVTTLPAGYRTRVYRGTTYYYRGDVVYRTAPGGYVVIPRPWS